MRTRDDLHNEFDFQILGMLDEVFAAAERSIPHAAERTPLDYATLGKATAARWRKARALVDRFADFLGIDLGKLETNGKAPLTNGVKQT